MNQQRVIPVMLVILTVVVIGFGLFQAIKTISPGTHTPTPSASPTPRPVSLLDYTDSDDAVVKFTTYGHIVAKEHHVDQFLSVSKAHRTLDITRAYIGTSELSRDFDNNAPAFDDFMRALNGAGFTKIKTPNPKSKAPKPADTEIGLCPTGERYIYELVASGQTLFRAWSTSCGDPTTFGGVPTTIKSLFQNQIPDYAKLAASVRP